MPIALTRGDCQLALVALDRLAALPWKLPTAYHLSKLLRLVRLEAQAFERARAALIKECGIARAPTDDERARGAEAEVWDVPQDRMGVYLERYAQLCAASVAIDWAPLRLAALDGVQPVTGLDLANLGPLLAEEDPT